MVFPYFLQFKPKFCNKELMIWAIVSSRSSFFLTVYSFSIFSYKEYNQSDFGIDHFVMFMCIAICCVVGKGCLLWAMCSLGKTLLAFALLHFGLQGKTGLLFQVSSYFCIPIPCDEKDISLVYETAKGITHQLCLNYAFI